MLRGRRGHRSARLRVAEAMRAEVKALSSQVGQARRRATRPGPPSSARRSRELGDEERIATAEAEADVEQRQTGLLYLPNLPADDAPDGAGEADNVGSAAGGPGRTPGAEPTADAPAGAALGDRRGAADPRHGAGAQLSGSMFPLYRGPGRGCCGP